MLSINELKNQASETPIEASVLVQLQSKKHRVTKTNKPYLELNFADSSASFALKLWSDSPLFSEAGNLVEASFLQLDGEWTQNSYGLNANHLAWSFLDEAAINLFLVGDPDIVAKQNEDFGKIQQLCESIKDPRLNTLALHFLEKHGDKFRRTAAAKKNHHARRGGLVEHVAMMMRSADALCLVYQSMNRDLLLAGVLFHDVGKLWENSYAENSFVQIHHLHGEMLGHITLGIEFVNQLWRAAIEDSKELDFSDSQPASHEVKLHLLHLIASHHGALEFGSPVLPRTPEAFLLHYVDNIDAKLEMLKDAYSQSNELVTGIYERSFPLPSNLVKPLPRHEA